MSDALVNELRSLNEQKGRIIAEMYRLDEKWGVETAEEMRKKADDADADAARYEELEEENDNLTVQMEDIIYELPDDVDIADVTGNL